MEHVPAPVREVAELSASLSSMAQRLEQRADYIRDFAAHMSHDFKTPLATIGGTVELLRDHLAEMSGEERERFLGNVQAEAARLTRLVQRLLDLARADVASADPAGHCRPALLIAAAAQGREAVSAEISGDPTLKMGAESFESILGNLLDNAIQHGGPDVRVDLSLRIEGDQAILTVADDGRGVSPANQERIFMPFFTTARKQGGTGLGLAIVRSLVEAHGGTITLMPSPKGAAFEIRLPCLGR
jgi:signal transduction histidine kinase